MEPDKQALPAIGSTDTVVLGVMSLLAKIQIEKTVTIVANLGVIAGLVLVAYQINQSIEITRAQMINDYFIADMQLEMKMMGENPHQSLTKAIYEPETLTQEDLAVLDRYFNYGIVQISRLGTMRDLGYVSTSDLETRIGYLSWHFGNPAGRKWWDNFKEGANPKFVLVVEEILANATVTQNKDTLDSMIQDSSE